MRYFLFFISILCTTIGYAQNQLDSLGQKQGIWLEDYGHGITQEAHYRDGALNGECRVYKDGRLWVIENYEDDVLSGVLIELNPQNNKVISVLCNFALISDTDSREDNVSSEKKHYKCYAYLLDMDGCISSEGWLAFDGNDYMVEVQEIGEWKYYEKGEIIKTILFKW